MPKLKNCWEVMKCGYGPHGSKAKQNGVCKAALEKRLDGVLGGTNGGRACWFVNKTFDCRKGIQGDFSDKYPACLQCKFYRHVREEEGDNFEVSLTLNTYFRDR